MPSLMALFLPLYSFSFVPDLWILGIHTLHTHTHTHAHLYKDIPTLSLSHTHTHTATRTHILIHTFLQQPNIALKN